MPTGGRPPVSAACAAPPRVAQVERLLEEELQDPETGRLSPAYWIWTGEAVSAGEPAAVEEGSDAEVGGRGRGLPLARFLTSVSFAGRVRGGAGVARGSRLLLAPGWSRLWPDRLCPDWPGPICPWRVLPQECRLRWGGQLERAPVLRRNEPFLAAMGGAEAAGRRLLGELTSAHRQAQQVLPGRLEACYYRSVSRARLQGVHACPVEA